MTTSWLCTQYSKITALLYRSNMEEGLSLKSQSTTRYLLLYYDVWYEVLYGNYFPVQVVEVDNDSRGRVASDHLE